MSANCSRYHPQLLLEQVILVIGLFSAFHIMVISVCPSATYRFHQKEQM